MWMRPFFCGSCAVIRRGPLDEIGGIAVETVTEDAPLSLRLHRRSHTSAYMRIPQAAGLATESLSAHIGQRIRARGMVRFSVLDNPLFGKGLKLAQRIFVNAMLHLLSGIPAAYISHRAAGLLAVTRLYHLCAGADRSVRAAAYDSCQPDQLEDPGKYRHSFWSEIYETVLAWYIAPPTFSRRLTRIKASLTSPPKADW